MAASVQEDESSFTGPKFVPPVYSQRYGVALDMAAKIQAKKVVDMGCGECKLVALMRRQSHVEELIGVDVDGKLLQAQESFIKPLTADYIQRRERPLQITLMQGSIAQPDQRIVKCDLLTCIEVIEHLEAEVLEKVPHSLFGLVCPKVAIVTTPNADFNVLFPNLTGFRHYDHKFEWSRKQFQSWCLAIAGKYHYSVEFSGVGAAPAGRESLGYCSQIATFVSQESPSSTNSELLDSPYTVVAEVTYPYLDNPLSPKEKLCNEAVYYLNMIAQDKMTGGSDEDSDEYEGGGVEDKVGAACNEEEGKENRCRHCRSLIDLWTVHVALKELFKFPQIQHLTVSVEDIRSALQLTSSINLDETNTCAVFQETDQSSEQSNSSDASDNPGEQADIGNICEGRPPVEMGGGPDGETTESWE